MVLGCRAHRRVREESGAAQCQLCMKTEGQIKDSFPLLHATNCGTYSGTYASRFRKYSIAPVSKKIIESDVML